MAIFSIDTQSGSANTATPVKVTATGTNTGDTQKKGTLTVKTSDSQTADVALVQYRKPVLGILNATSGTVASDNLSATIPESGDMVTLAVVNKDYEVRIRCYDSADIYSSSSSDSKIEVIWNSTTLEFGSAVDGVEGRLSTIGLPTASSSQSLMVSIPANSSAQRTIKFGFQITKVDGSTMMVPSDSEYEVVLTQAAKGAVSVTDSDSKEISELKFDYTGGEQSINVTSNKDFTVEVSDVTE